MKKYIILLLVAINVFALSAQVVDTTFYDKNWQGVKFKELAQYVRYDFDFKDPNYLNKVRIFYLGGTLESEGTPISHNKFDGTMSRWKGELTRYYQNSKKKETSFYNEAGLLSGKKSVWSEQGNLLSEENYDKGILQGQSIIFSTENPDICYITQFEQGKPLNNETVIYYRSGKSVKANYFTKKIITTKPSLEDCKFTIKDGVSSWYYDMNGIYVALNFTKTMQFGKYYQCFIVFTNDTNDPIEINPTNISGQYFKADKTRDIELMPAEEYLQKIANSQAFSQALSGFASGMSTYNAGYSTSTSQANVVGYGGWASGTSTTTTFNANERQAILNQEQQKLDNQAAAHKQVKDAIDGSVLKRTMVQPGEKIVKTFYIKYLSSDMLVVNLDINGYTYSFEMGKDANGKSKQIGSTNRIKKAEKIKEKAVFPLLRPGVEIGTDITLNESAKASLTLEYIAKPWWSIHTGIGYGFNGYSIYYDHSNFYGSIFIPLTAELKLNTGRWFRVYGGGGIMNRIAIKADDPLRFGQGLNRYMIGLKADAGIEIRCVRIGVSYFSDLTPFSVFDEKLSGINITLGWRIGGSKAYIKA